MTVIDKKLREREGTALVLALQRAGVDISELEQLRETSNQSVISERVLVEHIGVFRESRMAWAVVVALGWHRCAPGTITSLIAYFDSLSSFSFDASRQYWNRDAVLREGHPRASKIEQAKAIHVIENEWYFSHDPPQREPIRVYEEGFPDPVTCEAYHDSNVKDAIGNALLWQAKKEYFDQVVTLLVERQGNGRFMFPDVLVKCDRKRAPEVLMRVLNDPDIGAHAMKALGKLSYGPARPYFEKFLDHPIKWVQREAKKGLDRLDKAEGRKTNKEEIRFQEVVPEADRLEAAKALAQEGEEPEDIKGEVSGFSIGCMAEDEGMWGQTLGVELDDLNELMNRLDEVFGGDFSGRRGRALGAEINNAEHEDWKAYVLSADVNGKPETVWFHYFMDDIYSVDITMWGSKAFIELTEPLVEFCEELGRATRSSRCIVSSTTHFCVLCHSRRHDDRNTNNS